MKTSSLHVWGGALTIIVGLFLVLFGLLPVVMLPTSEPLIEWVRDADWSLLNGLALVMTVLTPLALTSLYARQAEEAGKLGFTGFLMAFTGSVLFAGVQFDEALLWRIFAQETPALLDPAGPMFTDPAYSAVYLGMGILYILGFILFGASAFRGGVFPRAASLMLIAGVPLYASGVFLPPLLRATGAVLAGASFLWMGMVMARQEYNDATEMKRVRPGAIS